MSFPRYPAYKPSGVEWLGEVPEHWNVLPLKRRSRLLTEKTDRRDNPIALENIEGWTGRLVETDSEFLGEGVAFESGDILFGKLRPYLAKVYLAANSGQAVGDFHVIHPFDSLHSRFLQFLLLTKEMIDLVNGSTFGAKMPRASWDFLASLHLTIPPLDEQARIATFLDHETAKIDALIAEQQRLIELLQEKRQAVISHAVTKGLNPDAPMKDSGVEWLGEVPEHWSIGKLSYVADVIDPNPSHRNPVYTDGGQPFISTVEFRPSGTIEFDTPRRVAEETVLEQEVRCRFRKGSLAFSRKGTIGAVRELPYGLRFALLDSLCVINPSLACKSNFLQLYFASAACSMQLESMMRGAALPQVSVGDVRRLLLPCPSAKEQQEIVNYLLPLLAHYDMLIEVSGQSGALLADRRSALISAAVTG